MEKKTEIPKNRLPWIDNLRMFAIVSVVLFHVMNYWFDLSIPMSKGLNTLIIGFNMPVFFVVSGYVAANKFFSINSYKDLWRLGCNAFVRMLLPTIFFTLLLLPLGITSGLMNHYWFMHSLFRLYAILAIASYIVYLLPIRSMAVKVILLSLLSFALSFLLGNYTVEFVLYFISGMLMRHYKLMDRISIGGGIGVLVITLFLFHFTKEYNSFYQIKAKDLLLHDQLPWLSRQCCGMGFSITLFYVFYNWINKENVLTQIGAMTLGIYLIHAYLIESFIPHFADVHYHSDHWWGWLLLWAITIGLITLCYLLIRDSLEKGLRNIIN